MKSTRLHTAILLIALSILLLPSSTRAGNGRDLAQLLPKSSAVIVGVDVDRCRTSVSCTSVVNTVLSVPQWERTIGYLKVLMDEPLGSYVSTLVVGVAGDFGASNAVTFVIEGSIVDNVSVRAATMDVTTRRVGDLKIHLFNKRNGAFARVGRWLVFAIDKDDVLEVSQRIARRQKAQNATTGTAGKEKKSPPRLRPGAHIWFDARLSAIKDGPTQVDRAFRNLRRASGTITMDQGLRLTLRGRTPSDGAAAQLVGEIRSRFQKVQQNVWLRLSGVAGLLARANVTQHQRNVVLKLYLSGRQLSAVLRVTRALLARSARHARK